MMSLLKNMDLKNLKDKLNFTHIFSFGILNEIKQLMNSYRLQPLDFRLNNKIGFSQNIEE
jgi:hypothetical protein